jgi:type I restriction enzyme, S subunit
MSVRTKLPEGWAKSRIGDAVEDRIDQGLPEDASEFTYVDISAVDNQLKEITAARIIPTAKAPSRARQRIHQGDVLVSTTRPNLNAVALVPTNLDGAIASTGFTVLRPVLLDSRWLFSVVQCEDFVTEMSALVKGALYPAVRPADVHDYVMPVPPLAEQIRISSKLSRLLKRGRKMRGALESLPALIQDYRAAVLEAACTGRLVPTEAELARKQRRAFEPASVLLERILHERRARWEAGQLAKMRTAGKAPKDDKWKDRYKETEPPDLDQFTPLPAGWANAAVGQCGFVQLGRQRSPDKRSKDYPRPYIRAANITESGIDVTDVLEMEFPPDELERFRLEVGDVLLSEASGSPEQVGKPAVWLGEIEDCCFQNTVIRFKPVILTSDFILILFRFFYTSGAFARVAGGVGINHLGADKFSRMEIPLPPLAEQKRIAAEVERRLSAIARIAKQVTVALEQTSQLRVSLFYRALSGKLVEQQHQDEPASKLLGHIRAIKEERVKQPRVWAVPPDRIKKENLSMLTLEDIKPTHLADILRQHNRPLDAKALWKESQLSVDDFYAQLKKELGKSLKETGEERLLEVKL